MIWTPIVGIFLIVIGLGARRQGLRSFAVLGLALVLGALPTLSARGYSGSLAIALSYLAAAVALSGLAAFYLDVRQLRREAPDRPTILSRLFGRAKSSN